MLLASPSLPLFIVITPFLLLLSPSYPPPSPRPVNLGQRTLQGLFREWARAQTAAPAAASDASGASDASDGSDARRQEAPECGGVPQRVHPGTGGEAATPPPTGAAGTKASAGTAPLQVCVEGAHRNHSGSELGREREKMASEEWRSEDRAE